jgi:LPXTG-motif cell wall-anchored protein
MGPYYRNTSQGTGEFFDMFYQHPILMLVAFLVVVAAGFYFWKKSKNISE